MVKIRVRCGAVQHFFEVDRDLLVVNFKELVASTMEMEPCQIRLFFRGKALVNYDKNGVNVTLFHYDVKNHNDTVECMPIPDVTFARAKEDEQQAEQRNLVALAQGTTTSQTPTKNGVDAAGATDAEKPMDEDEAPTQKDSGDAEKDERDANGSSQGSTLVDDLQAAQERLHVMHVKVGDHIRVLSPETGRWNPAEVVVSLPHSGKRRPRWQLQVRLLDDRTNFAVDFDLAKPMCQDVDPLPFAKIEVNADYEVHYPEGSDFCYRGTVISKDEEEGKVHIRLHRPKRKSKPKQAASKRRIGGRRGRSAVQAEIEAADNKEAENDGVTTNGQLGQDERLDEGGDIEITLQSPSFHPFEVFHCDLENSCGHCQKAWRTNCKLCGCNMCGEKDRPDQLLMCDECGNFFHVDCVGMDGIPDDDWYCNKCRRNDKLVINEEDLDLSKTKKAKMPSATATNKWAKGNQCNSVTKTKTFVDKSHRGAIPGVLVGTSWLYRTQVSAAEVHRPPVSGIASNNDNGCLSVVVSGGYEDDIDHGDYFIYTGEGGRDLSGNKRTNVQSFDQPLFRGNLHIAMTCDAPIDFKNGATARDWRKSLPIRVIRGEGANKHGGTYGPQIGYRYDGLYKVEKYWTEPGQSKFLVWRYLFRRDDPEPAPWTDEGKQYIKDNNLYLQLPEDFDDAKWLDTLEKKGLVPKGTKLPSASPASDSGKDSKAKSGRAKKMRTEEQEIQVQIPPMPGPSPSHMWKPTAEQLKYVKADRNHVSLWEGLLSGVVEPLGKNGKKGSASLSKDETQPSTSSSLEHPPRSYATFRSFLETMYEEVQCQVCFVPVNKPADLPCHHIFCGKCLVDWRKTSDACPSCRGPLFYDSDSGSKTKKIPTDVNFEAAIRGFHFAHPISKQCKDAFGFADTSVTGKLQEVPKALQKLIGEDKKRTSEKRKKSKEPGEKGKGKGKSKSEAGDEDGEDDASVDNEDGDDGEVGKKGKNGRAAPKQKKTTKSGGAANKKPSGASERKAKRDEVEEDDEEGGYDMDLDAQDDEDDTMEVVPVSKKRKSPSARASPSASSSTKSRKRRRSDDESDVVDEDKENGDDWDEDGDAFMDLVATSKTSSRTSTRANGKGKREARGDNDAETGGRRSKRARA
ncbi:E3 ubiquitin-protein ligase uhrf1 [Quaeritorhiza haematococci]|nr:E3 ubiquitin-protein ligase uhrf1 [Quaeritorhiza haematococci]